MHLRFLLLIFFCWTGLAHAEVPNLYQSEIFVESQSQQDRNLAIRKALAEVLVKVSGQLDIEADPVIQPVLDRASGYVRQYRYLSSGDQADSRTIRKLRVLFDEFAVNKALEGSGLSVWGADRTAVLAWVAVENNNRRYLLEPESHPRMTAAIELIARKRGLSLLLPLMDLTDQSAISFNDVWGDFDSRLRQASSRYGVESFVSCRLLKKKSWKGEWSYYHKGEVSYWSTAGTTQTEALQSGFDKIFSYQASRDLPDTMAGEPEKLSIMVSGIRDAGDLGWLHRFLLGWKKIESIQWREVNGSVVQLAIETTASAASLKEFLDSGERMFATNSMLGSGQEGALRYEIVP